MLRSATHCGIYCTAFVQSSINHHSKFLNSHTISVCGFFFFYRVQFHDLKKDKNNKFEVVHNMAMMKNQVFVCNRLIELD